MRKALTVLCLFALLMLPAASPYAAASEFRVTKVELIEERPKGLGYFKPRGNNEYKRGEDWILIYIEVAGCKTDREENFFKMRLAVDMRIYYEDSICVFDEEEANIYEYKTARNTNDG